MTTKTIHTLKVQADIIKSNLISSFIDLLHDEKGEDIDIIEADINRLTDCLQQLNKKQYSSIFAEGYTSLLLGNKDFQQVENFFNEYSNNDNHIIEIVVVDVDGKIVEVIEEDSISY